MTQHDVAPTFAGFDPAHTTSVPDILFDELLAVLSGPEFKVLCYITRRTRGFCKEWDAISLTQFTDGITTKDGRVLDRGCGITVRSRVIKILESLEEQGYIEIKKSEVKTGIIYYRLRYASVVSDTSTSVENDTHNKQLTINSKQESNPPTTQPLSPVATLVASHTPVSQEIVSEGNKDTSKPAKPSMPEASMPWGPEKMVQITECLRFTRGERGAYFSITPVGKKGVSQRDRQLAAAKKILAEIPTLTQEEYVQVYSDRNDEWWNREQGSLTVETMAANTPHKVMRTVELLEKVRTRSERIKEKAPSTQTQKQPDTSTADKWFEVAKRFENRPPTNHPRSLAAAGRMQ